MSQTFPKSSRLRYRRQFEHLARYGHKIPGRWINIELKQGRSFDKMSGPKLGITVTKKFGKAHDRNRFKRVVREAFRLCKDKLPQNISINVRPAFSYKSNAYLLKTQEAEQEILHLLQSAGKLS